MRFKIFCLFLLASVSAHAQQKWNLLQCVQYAMDNNLTVKQTALQEKTGALTLQQSRMGRYPNLNFNNNLSYNFGPTQDASFRVVNGGSLSLGTSLQSSVEIFNWYSRKNTVLSNQWELEAAKANTEKLKNDVALAVANFYLQALLAAEQVKITEVQLDQSRSQFNNTRKLVDAGALPELNAAELEAQVARDSANVITAKGNASLALLNLKAYMSMDAAQPFEIDTPPVERIPVETMAELQPDAVYASAIANLPQQRFNEFKLKAAKLNIAIAKAARYPVINGFASLNTGFNDKTFNVEGYTTKTVSPYNIGSVTVDNIPYSVYSNPSVVNTPVIGKRNFFPQLSDNFRKSFGISISVPILNGGSARTNWEKSKVAYNSLELQKQIDNNKLKQDIYQAYENARIALEKFNASRKSVETAEKSNAYASKRYAVGMLSTLELITNQNNLFTQKLQHTLNQYDYVFKMKVLEFYKGKGLKL